LQPLRFIDRELLPLIVYTTRRMAQFVGTWHRAPCTSTIHLRLRVAVKIVGCAPTTLALIPNTTLGLNAILQSLDLQRNDAVLTLNIEYGISRLVAQMDYRG
jgi:hypothetical protein